MYPTVLSPSHFFFLKKRNQKGQNRGNSRNVSPGVGKRTRHVPAFPKDYHTAVAEMETNDLLTVRSQRRLPQSEGRWVFVVCMDGTYKGDSVLIQK